MGGLWKNIIMTMVNALVVFVYVVNAENGRGFVLYVVFFEKGENMTGREIKEICKICIEGGNYNWNQKEVYAAAVVAKGMRR